MKTVNGNNKLERQINKAKKYLGVELKECSNKYLKINDFDKENTFIMFINKDNARLNNAGDLWILEPLNWNDSKPLFIKKWATIESYENWFMNDLSFIIFRTENEQVKSISQGCDDVWLLDKFINSKREITSNPYWTIEIRKN